MSYLLPYTKWRRIFESAINEENKNFDNLVGTYSLDQLPKALEESGYSPEKGYIRISDGNPILAKGRAESLKKLITKELPNKVDIESNNIIITINDSIVHKEADEEYQYVEGLAEIKIRPFTKPLVNPYKYSLLSKIHVIKGQNKPYLMITTSGAGDRTQNEYNYDDQHIAKTNELIKQQNPGAANGFITFNVKSTTGTGGYFNLVPIPEGFDAWKNETLYFKDESNYLKYKEWIKGIARISGDTSKTNDLRNQTGVGEIVKSNGIAATIIQDLTGSKLAKGTQLTVAYDKGAIGELGNIPKVDINKEQYETIKLDPIKLDNNYFKDNLIGVKPEYSDEIINMIVKYIDSKVTDTFQLSKISIALVGHASSQNATNRLPKGTDKPDHTYNGHVPENFWVHH
jgi:hypothetical protein